MLTKIETNLNEEIMMGDNQLKRITCDEKCWQMLTEDGIKTKINL